MAKRKQSKNKEKEQPVLLDTESDDEDSGMRDKSQQPNNTDNSNNGNLLSTKELFGVNNHHRFMMNQDKDLKNETTDIYKNSVVSQLKKNAIKNDFMAELMRESGVSSSFSEAEYAIYAIDTYFNDAKNDIQNKWMYLDPSIKQGEAGTAKAYKRFDLMELLLAIAMLLDTSRAKRLIGIHSDIVLGEVCMSLREFIIFFIRYAGEARGDFVQSLHGRWICGDPKEKMHVNAKLAADSSILGRFKLPGFDGRSNIGSNAIKPSNGGKKKKGGNWIDLKPYRDKSNPLFVPPPYCIFHHRTPRGCNRGSNCTHKHTMWTDEELAQAKK